MTYWPEALKSGAQLITNARVTKLISRGDQVLGAEFLDLNGQLREQRADVVVLAGNGIGTPRLLLLSATSEHPNGLPTVRIWWEGISCFTRWASAPGSLKMR